MIQQKQWLDAQRKEKEAKLAQAQREKQAVFQHQGINCLK